MQKYRFFPSEDSKTSEFNQYKKYGKAPFISPTTKVSEHIPSSFLMCTISSLKRIENKHNVCRSKIGKDNFKWRRMTLSCSKETIIIVKRNNV